MKRLLAIAAFLLASSTAQAQYTFEYGGHTIRIDPDRGTVSIPGVYDNTGTAKKAKRPHGNQENARSKQGTQDAKSDIKSDTKNDVRNDPPAAPASAPTDTRDGPDGHASSGFAARARQYRGRRTEQLDGNGQQCARRDGGCSTVRTSTRVSTATSEGAGAANTTGAIAGRRGRSAARARIARSCAGSSARSQFAGRRLVDRGEGRQGPHRAMRHQSLRLFGRHQFESEWRAGSDQHATWQGSEMERPNSRSEHRQHLRFNDRVEGLRYPARAGLRFRRHVLRRTDLVARELAHSEIGIACQQSVRAHQN